jgi:hypothetical protein
VITYYFLDGTENQRRNVSDVIKAWEECANITFQLVTSLPADVRIKFINLYSYSTSVTAGKKNPNMYLYRTVDNNTLTPFEKGDILRKFGRFLGLGLEYRSPDMKQHITLNEAGTLR